MAEEQHPTKVNFKSGTHPIKGWETVQIIYSQDGRILNGFEIARDAAGTILRKTDTVLDHWEIISDANDLRGFRECFNARDKLAAQLCGQCSHSLASHIRDVSGATNGDHPFQPPRGYDILSDKPIGESGCSECSCRQWKP